MSWTLVASTNATNDASGTTLDAAASFNLQTGDVVKIMMKGETGFDSTTISAAATTGAANNLTFDSTEKVSVGGAGCALGYLLSATANATATFRVTLGTACDFRRAIFYHWRPPASTTVTKDGTGSANSGSSTTAVDSGNMTTTSTDGIATGCYGETSAISISSPKINGNAATQPSASPVGQTASWYVNYTAGFTGSASATAGSATDWRCAILALKATATSGPTLTSTTPSDDATSVPLWLDNLALTFGTNIEVGSGNLTLKNDTLGTTIATVAITSGMISGATATVPVNVMLEYGHAYHVEVDNDAIRQASDHTSWPGISNSTSWSFTALNAIDFVAASAAAFSTGGGTTITASWPTTGTDERGVDILVVSAKPTTSGAAQISVPDSAGFRWLSTLNAAGGYGGSSAADTGDSDLHLYWRPSSPATSGSFTVTVTVGATNGVAMAKVLRFKSNVARAIVPASSTGQQTAAGNLSVKSDSNPPAWKTRPGDLLLGIFITPTDIQTGANFSAEAFTQTGVTFSSVTEQQEWNTTNGFDCGGFAAYAQVLTGRGVDKITMTATAVTTTNVRGPAAFVRLRAI